MSSIPRTASQPTTGKSVAAVPAAITPDDESSRNVYIRNLDPRVSAEELRQIFEPFGEVEAHKLMVDIKTGVSRGFGFVMYRRATDAGAAVAGLDGFEVYGSKLQVRLADMKTRPPGEPTRRLFLRNLPPSFSQSDVEQLCGTYGVVVSCVVRRDERHAQVCSDGGLTLVAHVEMGTVEAAQSVVRSLNNSTMFCPHVPSALLSKVVDHSKQLSPTSYEQKLQAQLQQQQQQQPQQVHLPPTSLAGNISTSNPTTSTTTTTTAPGERRRALSGAQHSLPNPSANFGPMMNLPPPPPPNTMPMPRITVGNRGQMHMGGREHTSPIVQFPSALPPPPLMLPSPQTPSLQPAGTHSIIQFDSSFAGESFAAGGWYTQPSPSHQQSNVTPPTFMSSSLTANPMQVHHHSTPTQTLQTAYVGPSGQIVFFRHDEATSYSLHPSAPAPQGQQPTDVSMQGYGNAPSAAYHHASHHPQHYTMVSPSEYTPSPYGTYGHHHHHHHHQHHPSHH